MKPTSREKYNDSTTDLCERVLLTVCGQLKEFENDLVLIGGLVPRFLTKGTPPGGGPATLDVDLGMSLGIETGMYESISDRLINGGFRKSGPRFAAHINGTTVNVDFLANSNQLKTSPPKRIGDVMASCSPGINRALEKFRRLPISGIDLRGVQTTVNVNVCELGPYICLKLYMITQRNEPKDVADIVLAVKFYDLGLKQAAAEFKNEKDLNPLFPTAIQVLNESFINPEGVSPLQYSSFYQGNILGPSGGNEDFLQNSKRLQEEARSIAYLLLT